MDEDQLILLKDQVNFLKKEFEFPRAFLLRLQESIRTGSQEKYHYEDVLRSLPKKDDSKDTSK